MGLAESVEGGYNDYRYAKAIEDSIAFAAKRQVWQQMIEKILCAMRIASLQQIVGPKRKEACAVPPLPEQKTALA